MKKNRQKDQWVALSVLIITVIILNFILSGGQSGQQSYIQAKREHQFCLDLSKEISGTVQYKQTIYQDCKGD